jgi:PAS domain S-box-containing protein
MSRDEPHAPSPGESGVPAPDGQDERLSVLAAFGFEELEGDEELSAIARFAGELCDTPSAVVSIVEADRLRYLARAGYDGEEPQAAHSFCAYAMQRDALLEVPDASSDPRFTDNALVAGEPHIRFYAGVPLKTRDGVPLGALCVIDTAARPAGLTPVQRHGLEVLAQAVMRRLAARRAGRMALEQAAESARAMREIADQLPGVVWSADGDARFDYFNGQWVRATGEPPPQEISQWRAFVHPDDISGTFEAWAQSFASGEPFEHEYRLRQLDGTWRWTLARALPMRDREGKVTRWYGTLTDIDSRHRQSESRDLLARELSHRIKNIFAVIAGLVSLRARRRPEVAAFANDLADTIRALGRAHDFVRPVEGAKGDSLTALLNELMAPYAGGEAQVSISGHDCPIGPRAATPLALIFHELATNAAKYGALSVEGGRVAIALDCEQDDGIARLSWREQGGPQVTEPAKEGFGTRLLAMAVEGQLGGSFVRRYAPGGLEIDLTIPKDSLAK